MTSLNEVDVEKSGRTARPIIELSSNEARVFLLKPESYCTIDLPPYFQFNELLKIFPTNLKEEAYPVFGNAVNYCDLLRM